MSDTGDAIYGAFVSPNESDSNYEAANVVDGLFAIARSIGRLATAIEQVNESVDASEVKEALTEGVDRAFGVYPSQVLNAVADGAREALKDHK